ncbi:head GIN domain-containing protein [Maribacter sp. 2307UL18-2]|uniref:head GIN domain-containing protein n=1 Tax=Maribacter sp. 2307UL18-2 TaxID=3386274 RepID=UPI0039BCD5C5
MKKIRMVILTAILTSMPLVAQEKDITMSLERFDELKAFDQINVKLVKSDKNWASVSGDDTDEVKIVNNDGRLKIRMEVDNFLDGNETNVTLYHTEDLQLVDANEGAKITTDNDLEAKYLTLRSQEGAEIHAKVDTRNLDTKAISGGKIMVSGNAENQDVNVRSGGEYNAKDLMSNQTDVTIFAGGNAIITTDEYVDANVTAGGTIEIYGNPETIKEDKTLGGSIIVRK